MVPGVVSGAPAVSIGVLVLAPSAGVPVARTGVPCSTASVAHINNYTSDENVIITFQSLDLCSCEVSSNP